MGEEVVTREEVRKLMGGYATGSLTETERAALFAAALEYQDIFDELTEEHALKELIDSPGVRDRLLAGLRPNDEMRSAWWARPWPWVGAAGLVAVSIAVWMVMPGVQAPVQFAESRPVEVAVPAPAKDGVQTQAGQQAGQTAAATTVTRAGPLPAPEVEEAKKTEAAAAPSPAPQVQTLAQGAVGGIGVPAPQLSVRQGFAAARADARDAKAPVSSDALNYAITTRGTLRVTPLQAGFLELSAIGVADVLFSRNPVTANVSIEVPLPREVQQLRLDFSTVEGAPAPPAITSTQSSGTVVLPGGPNPRVIITIPAR